MELKVFKREIADLAETGLSGEQIAEKLGGQVEVVSGFICAIRRGPHTVIDPKVPRIGSIPRKSQAGPA